jgi:hypothetical protein
MKFIPGTLVALVLVLMLVPLSNAQQDGSSATEPDTQTGSEVQTSPSCTHLFTSGKSNSNVFLQYCVADDGLITSIQAPFGHFHLGDQGEGYSFCQESPPVEYHDYAAGDSGNWNPARIVSVNGASIKISRSTADGNWTLVQTISKVPLTGSIKVVMALTNNQSVARVVYLVRYAYLNPDGATAHFVTGASLQSAFGWHAFSNSPYYGLRLENTGAWSGYQQAFIQNTPAGPNACAFAFNAISYGVAEDAVGSTSLVYAYVDTVPAHGTKTVTLTYRGM